MDISCWDNKTINYHPNQLQRPNFSTTSRHCRTVAIVALRDTDATWVISRGDHCKWLESAEKKSLPNISIYTLQKEGTNEDLRKELNCKESMQSYQIGKIPTKLSNESRRISLKQLPCTNMRVLDVRQRQVFSNCFTDHRL